MNLSRLGLITVLAGTVLAVAPCSRADDQPDQKPAEKTDAKVRAGRNARLQRIADELKLTDEQKAKLKPIFAEQRQERMTELRGKKDVSREDRRAKAKEMREDLSAKLKPILTPEQFEKWNKGRAAGAQRRPNQP
jgi:periplasmic protein CpxP/Spy